MTPTINSNADIGIFLIKLQNSDLKVNYKSMQVIDSRINDLAGTNEIDKWMEINVTSEEQFKSLAKDKNIVHIEKLQTVSINSTPTQVVVASNISQNPGQSILNPSNIILFAIILLLLTYTSFLLLKKVKNKS